MQNNKVRPLLTLFSATVGGKCFRVYNHIPPKRHTRFIMDNTFSSKTRWLTKRELFKKFRETTNRERVSFDTIIEYCNLKLTEAITLFKEEN